MEDTGAKYLWDTTLLYPAPDSPELEHDFSAAASRATQFREKYFGKISDLDAGGLKEALVEYEALEELIVKPQLYAHLLFSADSGSDLNKALSQRSSEFGNLMSRELLFFDLEIMALPDDVVAGFCESAGLAGYRHYIALIRKFKPHILPEREERLLKQKTLTGTEAFSRLFDELSASFSYTLVVDGQEQQLTGEELLGLLHHPDAGLREEAFSTFLKRHEEHGLVFSAVFNNMALDHSQELELRGYSTPMEPTNKGNELDAAS